MIVSPSNWRVNPPVNRWDHQGSSGKFRKKLAVPIGNRYSVTTTSPAISPKSCSALMAADGDAQF
jgi:hypothetical protein